MRRGEEGDHEDEPAAGEEWDLRGVLNVGELFVFGQVLELVEESVEDLQVGLEVRVVELRPINSLG